MSSFDGIIDSKSIYEERIIELNLHIIQLKNNIGTKDTIISELQKQIKSLEFLVSNLLPYRIKHSSANLEKKLSNPIKEQQKRELHDSEELDDSSESTNSSESHNKKRKLRK